MNTKAMVALGGANSRMKDFYDVWICSKHLDFNTDTLLKAIDATYKWNAFVRKMGEKHLIDAFGTVVADLEVFALPALRALARGERITQQWKAGSGWLVS